MSIGRIIRKTCNVALCTMLLASLWGFTPRKHTAKGSRIPYFRDTIPVLDSLPAKDSLGKDTLNLKDTLFTVDSSLISTLKQPVFSTGRDSSVEILTDGKRMLYYYGDVTVTYEDISIKADYIAYNVQTKTVFAKGLPDSTGVVKGNPELKEGKNTYTMESVYYNFDTKKAKIKNMMTQEGEGNIKGKYIKKMADNSINIARGIYTTCDAEEPHFYLQMTTAKVINSGPVKKTVFGPAYTVIEGVPTPFALPFGFVPRISNRSGGVLFPTYGEETARGFYLRGLGYYFVFGDHLDLAATADIYTRGSWAVNVNSRYAKRYRYTGNLSGVYSVDITGEKHQPDYSKSKNFSLNWSHSQDAKARPGTTFRASVNFSSPSNSRYNSTTINQALTNQISSSISYGKTWAGTPFSLSLNALHNQNSRDSSYAVTFPNLTFTVSRINPFKRKVMVGKRKFYEDITFNYTAHFDNKINFKSSEVGKPDFFKKMRNGMQHTFSIGLPTFTVLRYIQASPGVNYGMNWYFSDATQYYDTRLKRAVTEYSDPFSTFGLTQTYNFSLSFNTRIYGLFNFGKNSKLQAMRHIITPSISFNYMPELGTRANGYRTYEYVDSDGKPHSVVYNKYSGQLYSPPGQGSNAGMGFSFGNTLEAKIKSQMDTTGKGVRKIKLIDQLNIGGSYNFLADSMKLSNISVNMSTTVFGKMGISANMTLDPYAINERGQRYNKLMISQGGFKPFRLTGASLSTSYTFQGEGRSRWGSDYKAEAGMPIQPTRAGTNSSASSYQRMFYHPVTGEYIPGGWVYYYDPNMPWSVNLNYSYSFYRSYQYSNNQLVTKNNHAMTLGISSQLQIYRDLRISLNTGVDLTKMQLTTTQLSGSFSLHCFQISFSWIPNGKWESWSFRICANASSLADLLQFKKNASYWDNGSGY
ncbi:MAG: LPS-assembly protein LptD [Bacteroidales bacterium]|nr:LPS-assembly protein LptD [Bacteroidales bacterium]